MTNILSHSWNLQMKKMHISSAAENFESFFADAAKSSVTELQGQLAQLESEFADYSGKLSTFQEEREGEQPSQEELDHLNDYMNLDHSISLLKERLLALMEMQAISLYKDYEIAQKELVSSAYSNVNKRDMYLWENVKAFFNSKGINFGRITGYDYVNQLRIVNNNIKHSSEIDSEVKKLSLNCFANLDYFTDESLKLFYERVSPEVPKFLDMLSKVIIEDLYEYSDERLQEIAESYTEKMDGNDLIKLADAIKKKADSLPKGMQLGRLGRRENVT
ncbi:TPA: hypothetical protein KDY52_004892 [Vibrio parahaemolyticus]|uniref:hypothetical protein n=2 Tax=Vibrio parahaemolyticus TaxID=670 RepID=UPI00041FBA66|nr:hypothetical protein [Vibrio parahaemolyticus]MBE3867377.1 hypothetical protein [Vibrio parahaemolyticus]HBC3460651.1 hypothetical protein [Vibrio parahaemolyticus]